MIKMKICNEMTERMVDVCDEIFKYEVKPRYQPKLFY